MRLVYWCMNFVAQQMTEYSQALELAVPNKGQRDGEWGPLIVKTGAFLVGVLMACGIVYVVRGIL